MSGRTLNILDAAAGNGAGAARRVIVCAGTGCVANGAYKVFQAFVDQIKAAGIEATTEFKPEAQAHDLRLNKSGCQGFCQMGPLVTLLPEEILYTRVKIEDVAEIIAKTLVGHEVVDRLLYVDPGTKKHCRGTNDIPFYQRQQRFVLRECGTIDPENIHEYIHHGGYAAARKAILNMSPEQVCQEILQSGLRGRGGGGFPTGRKWEAARVQKGPKKYVICNADEGDPGAFMNRSVMEGNPHSVLEGLLIAARGIGADETFIYVRTEYPLAVLRMRRAVDDARKMGFLGDDAFGSGDEPELRGDGRRGRVCVRRGDRDDCVHRGPARHAAAQAAVPGPERALGPADDHQQRRDPGPCRADHQRGRGEFPQTRDRRLARDENVRPHRPRGQHGPDRSAFRRDAPRSRSQHRRRHHRSPRQDPRGRIQGRADRRAFRRLSDQGAPGSAARLRFPARRRAPWSAPAASWR